MAAVRTQRSTSTISRENRGLWTVYQNGGKTLPYGFNFAPISAADVLKCACVEFIWACQSRTSSFRSLLRMAWRNEQLLKDPLEGRFWLVVQKQCEWPEVNQRSNLADKTPPLLTFASAAITMCSKVNTLLTLSGQRRRRNQFYLCCRGLQDLTLTNGRMWSKVMPSLPRQDSEAARCLHALQHNNSLWFGLKSVKIYAKVLHKKNCTWWSR